MTSRPSGARGARGAGSRRPAPTRVRRVDRARGSRWSAGDGVPGAPLRRVARTRQEVRSKPGLPALTAAVRATRGAILVTTGCVGHCELGAVVALGRRPASSAAVATEPGGLLPFTGGVVLPGMDRVPRAAALCQWVRAGGYEVATPPDELARPHVVHTSAVDHSFDNHRHHDG